MTTKTKSDAKIVRETADMIEDLFSWSSQRRASAHAADLRRIAARLEEIDAPGSYIARQDGAGNWWRVNLDGSLVKLGSVP